MPHNDGNDANAAQHPTGTRFGWQLLAPMHRARLYHTTSAIDDHRLVVVGGLGLRNTELFTSCYDVPLSVELLDTKKNRWYDLPDLTLSRTSGRLSSVVLKGRIYILGGLSPNLVTRIDIDRIGAPSEGAIILDQRQQERRPGRSNFAVSTDGTYIYIFGGCNDYPALGRTAQVYDPETDTWTDLPDMSRNRRDAAAVVVRDHIYVLGGYDRYWGNGAPSLVEVLNIKTRLWVTTSKEEEEIRLPTALSDISAVAIDDRWIVVTGGVTSWDDPRNDTVECETFIFDTNTKHWCKGSYPLARPRCHHAMSVLGNARIVVSGGTYEKPDVPSATATVECIDFKALLFPSWESVKHFILLRKLHEEGRALAWDDTDFLVEQTLTVVDDYIFGKIMSYFFYCPAKT